jgi:hypothetical protein
MSTRKVSFQVGDEVSGKFAGMEGVGTVTGVDDMAGRFELAPQSYEVTIEDEYGDEDHVVTGYDNKMDLVRRPA